MTTIEINNEINMEIVSPYYADKVYSIIDKNRDYLRKYLGWVDSTKSSEDTYNFIKEALKRYSEKKEITYFIINKTDVIGIMSIWISNEDTNTCEIGYWIIEEFSRRGIVTECARKIINIGFKYMEAKKIEISCAVENLGSNKIARKLGMENEGMIRNAEIVNDMIYDHNIYGLMKCL